MTVRSIPKYLPLLAGCLLAVGCHANPWASREQPFVSPHDRPFPLGQVTDAHWETQQTNAEAADFIFYDHEFEGVTARLTPLGRKHILNVALRLEHVPFPIVIEETPGERAGQLDLARRREVIDQLRQLGIEAVHPRVVIAPVFPEGITAREGESAYYRTRDDNDDNGRGGGSSGRGGAYR